MNDDTEDPKVGQNTGNAGKGRPKGAPNKMTAEVKQMILDALEQAGGVAYLARQADEKPAAFLALVGKVLPLQVHGAGENGEHLISGIKVTLVKADAN
jgi:hypothetical protein